ADDRAPECVRIFDNGVREGGRSARRAAVQRRAPRSLHHVPPEVGARASARREEVDLLHHVLTDVGDIEISGLAIKRDPPWVAKTEGMRGVVDAGSAPTPAVRGYREPVPLEGRRALQSLCDGGEEGRGWAKWVVKALQEGLFAAY